MYITKIKRNSKRSPINLYININGYMYNCICLNIHVNFHFTLWEVAFYAKDYICALVDPFKEIQRNFCLPQWSSFMPLFISRGAICNLVQPQRLILYLSLKFNLGSSNIYGQTKWKSKDLPLYNKNWQFLFRWQLVTLKALFVNVY